jgi:putative ABC transport system permease protein
MSQNPAPLRGRAGLFMFKNYLKITLRNLWRNKAFSAINILGLAIGMAVCLLISLYVSDELSYDRFHEKADRIVRLDMAIKFGGTESTQAVTAAPAGAALKQDYPFIENFVRLRETSALIKKGNQNIAEYEVAFADSTLFDVFTLPMLYGNPKTALTEPNSVVITESIAKKYFNTHQVLGKTLTVENNQLYKITGVIKDLPENSHLKRNIFLSMLNNGDSKENNWLSNNFVTYLVLKKATDAEILKSKFGEIIKKHIEPQASEFLNIKSMEDFEKAGNYLRFDLMPLTKIHLYSNKVAELSPNSNIQYVYIFSAVAIFILFIACINFMNLSTARSAGRAKEVGIRKVLGSFRSSLIGQFLSESVLLSLMAFVLSVVFASLILPYFNELAFKKMNFSFAEKPFLFPLLLLFAVVVGLLAGSYPAFFLSAFKPINVLKGKLSVGVKSGSLRSALVVFQFFASVFLIICTFVIYRQLSFIQNRQLGFNREQVLIINDTQALGSKMQSFKNEITKELPEVKSGTVSSYLPVPSWRSNTSFFPEGEIRQDNAVLMQNWGVDNDYVKTLGMQIVKGRDFDKNFLTDSSAIILNESAVQVLGFKDPIGKKIFNIANIETKETRSYTIIGVVKNFNYESLRENVGALSLILDKSQATMCFRLETSAIQQTLAKIESKWKVMATGQPFNYQFMDDAFGNIYRSEQRIGKIFISFALLAIFIACLGLFGLAAFSAEQRTKEIGIRKVLGASVSQIVTLLSKDFLKLVFIAFVIAVPLAWYVMHRWLQDFAYRIDISWWIFALAGVLALLIALLTVSFQAIKAALANPVKSLRTE